MQKYYPPTFEATQFHCVHCSVYSAQRWADIYIYSGNYVQNFPNWKYCTCTHCEEISVWHAGLMIVPAQTNAPQPHIDMPEACMADFEEARAVLPVSPKAAAALLRLVVQKLMIELGEKGNNINADISSLVTKGLPTIVQQAFDYCRVVGNNAVHPGEIQLDDTPEMAFSIFEMLNFIVEDRITKPKNIAELYSKLPAGAKEAIERRDADT